MNTDTMNKQAVTPEQVLDFSAFPQFRRLVAQLINDSPQAQEIRDMIELRDMLEETNEH